MTKNAHTIFLNAFISKFLETLNEEYRWHCGRDMNEEDLEFEGVRIAEKFADELTPEVYDSYGDFTY